MNKKDAIWLKALHDLKVVLNKNNCRYFLDTGTLLGAIRDHQFIRWDNDIDVGVVDCATCHETILAICHDMFLMGYNVTASEHEIAIFNGSGLLNLGVKFYERRGNNYETSFGKICGSQMAHMLHGSVSKNIIYKKGYGTYRLKAATSKFLRILSPIVPGFIIRKLSELSKVESRDLTIPADLLSDFSDYEFYGEAFKVPQNSAGYLQYRYGKDWETPKQSYNFITDDKSIKS